LEKLSGPERLIRAALSFVKPLLLLLLLLFLFKFRDLNDQLLNLLTSEPFVDSRELNMVQLFLLDSRRLQVLQVVDSVDRVRQITCRLKNIGHGLVLGRQVLSGEHRLRSGTSGVSQPRIFGLLAIELF